MSSPVRRMICDIPLKWLLFAALTALFIPLLDGVWLMRPNGGMPLFIAFFLGPLGTSLAAVKLPIWRLLPVSRRQIGHAQWWLGFGGPLIVILLSLVLATVVVSLAGAMRASPADVVALAGGECVAGVALRAMAMGVAAPALRKRVGTWGALLLLLPLVICFFAWAFSRPILTPALRLGLPMAGVIVIAVAIAGYLVESTIDDPMNIGRPARDPAGRLARPGMKGWAGLWRPFLGAAAFAAVTPVGLFIFIQLLTRLIVPLENPFAAAVCVAVLAMASLPFGAMVRTSARALRSLPVGAAVLTSVLLGAVAAVQLLAFVALYLVCRLWHGPVGALLVLLPLVVGVGACGLALMLRGWGRATALVWLLIFPVSELFFYHPDLAAPAMAAGVASVMAGWLWVYFELSRGRSAYQPSAIFVPRWRGR